MHNNSPSTDSARQRRFPLRQDWVGAIARGLHASYRALWAESGASGLVSTLACWAFGVFCLFGFSVWGLHRDTQCLHLALRSQASLLAMLRGPDGVPGMPALPSVPLTLLNICSLKAAKSGDVGVTASSGRASHWAWPRHGQVCQTTGARCCLCPTAMPSAPHPSPASAHSAALRASGRGGGSCCPSQPEDSMDLFWSPSLS